MSEIAITSDEVPPSELYLAIETSERPFITGAFLRAKHALTQRKIHRQAYLEEPAVPLRAVDNRVTQALVRAALARNNAKH